MEAVENLPLHADAAPAAPPPAPQPVGWSDLEEGPGHVDDMIELPRGVGLAVVDGGFSAGVGGIGIVLIGNGLVRLHASAIEDRGNDCGDAESVSAAMALGLAVAAMPGLRAVRVLSDRYDVVETLNAPSRRSPFPDLALDARNMRDAGVHVSARKVKGHTQTDDLPSRLHSLADALATIGRKEGGLTGAHAMLGRGFAMREGWLNAIGRVDPRLKAERRASRVASCLTRAECADFLGIEERFVDELLLAGHLRIGRPSGLVTRRSAAAIFVEMQRLRHSDFFDFDVAAPPAPAMRAPRPLQFSLAA